MTEDEDEYMNRLNKTIIVLFSTGSYGMSSVHFTASHWFVRDDGRLVVSTTLQEAGEFAAGQWIAVVDDDYRQPDLAASSLTAAQHALERIADGCARGSLTMSQIARIASDGLMEVRTA